MILIGLVLVLTGNLFNQMYLPFRLVLKLAIIFSFPIILYLFNFYEKIELDRLRGAWRKWRNPAKWKENLKKMKDPGISKK